MLDTAGRSSGKGTEAILLTGATGFLGTLIAAALLGQDTRTVVALVREGHDFAGLAARVLPELAAEGRSTNFEDLRRRLVLVTLTQDSSVDAEGWRTLAHYDIADVVHCAGCLDYFNDAELEAVNVAFTGRMLELARAVGSRRFVFISTAFSSGYLDGSVPERLHDLPQRGDPTAYTRTKRAAEWLVADSGLPYLIIRPSIVIGDSRTGRYSGKRYGLYQLWAGLERLLYDRHHFELHVVAPQRPLNFIHQDIFQNTFLYLLHHDANSVVNLVSTGANLPTVRDVWNLWLDTLGRPERVVYYDHLQEVRLSEIHPRQRAFMMFASVNIEIAGHPWQFETTTLQNMKAGKLTFTDATLPTIARCQRVFIESSPRLQQYLREFAPGREPLLEAAVT